NLGREQGERHAGRRGGRPHGPEIDRAGVRRPGGSRNPRRILRQTTTIGGWRLLRITLSPCPHEAALLSRQRLGVARTWRARRFPAVAADGAIRHPGRFLFRAFLAAARGVAGHASEVWTSYPRVARERCDQPKGEDRRD